MNNIPLSTDIETVRTGISRFWAQGDMIESTRREDIGALLGIAKSDPSCIDAILMGACYRKLPIHALLAGMLRIGAFASVLHNDEAELLALVAEGQDGNRTMDVTPQLRRGDWGECMGVQRTFERTVGRANPLAHGLKSYSRLTGSGVQSNPLKLELGLRIGLSVSR